MSAMTTNKNCYIFWTNAGWVHTYANTYAEGLRILYLCPAINESTLEKIRLPNGDRIISPINPTNYDQ